MCAPREPSALRSVQPSPSVKISSVVCRNHGSIAITSPGRSGKPRPGRPSFGMCGSPCMVRPTPWPPNWVLMRSPASRATVAIAWEMSPTRLPTSAASIPAASARSVTSISRRSSSRGVPTTMLRAESDTQPSTLAAKSTLSRSPSRST